MYPRQCMYVEMDSMDQMKSSLPHFKTQAKCMEDNVKIKTHVTAVMIPGVGTQEYVYTTNFAHDANTTITVLHRYALHLER